MTESVVFISYSHKDEPEKNALLSHLSVLEKAQLLTLWSDDRIIGGDDWEQAIFKAITQARVAVLLITANFLTSDFILSQQIPLLLERREQEGLIIFPIIAKPCAWRTVGWLAKMNVIPRDGTPIWSHAEHYADQYLAKIAETIALIIKNSSAPVRPPFNIRPSSSPNAGKKVELTSKKVESAISTSWRVLVVEDELTWQKRLTRILREINCTATIAGSYDEAEIYLANAEFDLVTIDLNLDTSTQYADGLELILQIRRTLGPRFPLIIITGTGNMEEQRRAFKDHNVFDFIQKARLDFEEFQTTVLEAIESAR